MRQTLVTAFMAAVLLAGTAASGQAADIRLTTLDWPPYSGSGLPELGASSAVVARAAAAAGDTFSAEVLPFQRAVKVGLEDAGFVGYYPEYHSKDLEATCAFSGPLGTSPLGLVERKAQPLTWKTIDDLKGHTIGVVQGYVNTAEFDAKAADGTLTVEAVVDDATNLRKVAAGRIPAAVIDRHVMNYLLKNDPALAPLAGTLQFNPVMLERKTLHVCFRKSPEGTAARERFEAGLAKVDVEAVTAAAIGD